MNTQKSPTNICIAGVGMLTPLGNSQLAAAAIHAGISSYKEVSNPDLSAESLIVSMIPDPALPPMDEFFETEYDGEQLLAVEHLHNKSQRMVDMIIKALNDLSETSLVPIEGAPLILGLPEQIPNTPPFESTSFIKTVVNLSNISLHPQLSNTYSIGRTSIHYAINEAVALIQSGQHPCVLVGGVDCLLDMELLAALDEEQRLLSHESSGGFVVGEGAVVIALCNRDQLQGQAAGKGAIQLGSIGIGKEKGHRYSNETYTGDGLAEAFKLALNNQHENIASVMAGLNGEDMMAKEWGVAIIRNNKSFKEDFDILHPADCIGDLGAASGAMQLGVAAIGMTKGYIPSPCLVWSSSEHESRAAICLNKVS